MNDLTPAQARLLSQLRTAAAPVVVEGPRRYVLQGERLHYGTVEALERRGYLHRTGGELLLITQGEVFADTPALDTPDDPPADTEEARAPATPPAPVDTITPDDLDHRGRAPLLARRNGPPLGELLLDPPPARIVETPPRARAYPPAPRKQPRKDLSIFGGLWRLLRGALS
ncbi:MAG: hypothetical protein U5L04_09830 [Trueperaceae bacterium]|nr:hypothetical protein [Trueperaceae bacterium]